MNNEVLATVLAVYLLAGMFFLVASGALEAFSEGWIDLLSRRWLPVTTLVLYLLAVIQVTALWIFWPAVVWLRAHNTVRRIERRRAP